MTMWELYYCGEQLDEFECSSKSHARNRFMEESNFEVREGGSISVGGRLFIIAIQMGILIFIFFANLLVSIIDLSIGNLGYSFYFAIVALLAFFGAVYYGCKYDKYSLYVEYE